MSSGSSHRGSIILRVVLLIFAVWMVFSLTHLMKKYNSLKYELKVKIAQRDEIKNEVDRNKDMLLNGENADFIKKAASEKLGFVDADVLIFEDISGE